VAAGAKVSARGSYLCACRILTAQWAPACDTTGSSTFPLQHSEITHSSMFLKPTCEGDIGRGGAVALVVGDDLDAIVLPDTHAAIEQQASVCQHRFGVWDCSRSSRPLMMFRSATPEPTGQAMILVRTCRWYPDQYQLREPREPLQRICVLAALLDACRIRNTKHNVVSVLDWMWKC
jgi:hypothetical protein